MKKLQIVFLLLLVYLPIYSQVPLSQPKKDFVKFKAKIGFVNNEDRVKSFQYSEDGKEIIILGFKTIQVWDVKSGKLISSVPYSVQEYPVFGKLAAVLTFGLSTTVKMEKFENAPEADYFVAVEGEKDNRQVVVRQIETGRQLATLQLPLPTNSISFEKTLIVTRGEKDDKAQLGIWDNVDFHAKGVLPVDEYKWHHFLKNEEKILIGSGYTKVSYFGDEKLGNKFEIRDVKTGKVEKEFTAPDVKSEDYYHEIVFTPDEKFMMAERDKRLFVWEIDGQDSPKYIIASELPKGDADLEKVINQQYIVAKVDKKLRVYDFGGDGRPKHEFVSSDPKKTPEFLGNSEDGKYFAVKADGKMSFYEMDGNGQPFGEVSLLDKEGNATRCIAGDYCIVKNKRQKGEKHRSYFYNIKTGKVDFEVPFEFGWGVKFTPSKNYLYEENTGSVFVWDIRGNRSFSIYLDTDTTTCGSHEPNCTTRTYNTESILLSPNEKFFVKYGDGETTIYDAETGNESQSIFDPRGVTYKKNGKIKYSGFATVEISKDGANLLTFDSGKWSGRLQTVTIWDLTD